MRTILFVLALCLGAPAWATDAIHLRGQWNVMMPADPTSTGVLLIDAYGRVTYDGRWDPKYRASKGLKSGEGWAKLRGYYVASPPKIEFILTTGITLVERVHCSLQSSDLIHCNSGTHNTQLIIMTRVGPGPASLLK